MADIMKSSRSVVITGASSFVGMHLAEAFLSAGWQVCAVLSRRIELYDTFRLERLKRISGRAELRQLDLRDSVAITAFAKNVAPDLWVQHAGFTENYGSPDYDLVAAAAVNVAPLKSLYSALAGTGCGVIITGSSMEYAATNIANREDDPCWPDTPYGLSKLTESLAARQLALRYKVSTRVARLYIPFGAFDNPKKLLSLVGNALRKGQAIKLSACEQRRDFVAVQDVCKGYLAIADDLSRTVFDIFNLSSGTALPLKSLLLAMANQAGQPSSLLQFGTLPMRLGEPLVSFGDNSKAKKLLHWMPEPTERKVAELVEGFR